MLFLFCLNKIKSYIVCCGLIVLFFVVVFFQPLGVFAKGLFYIVLPSVTRWAMMRAFISELPTGFQPYG